MRDFRYWRKMTWAILIAIPLAAVWIVASGFSLFIVGVSLAAVGLLCALWYFTEPLWRQGHGAQMRRRPAPAVAFKPVKSLVAPRDPNQRH
jgi:hypothetical protein